MTRCFNSEFFRRPTWKFHSFSSFFFNRFTNLTDNRKPCLCSTNDHMRQVNSTTDKNEKTFELRTINFVWMSVRQQQMNIYCSVHFVHTYFVVLFYYSHRQHWFSANETVLFTFFFIISFSLSIIFVWVVKKKCFNNFLISFRLSFNLIRLVLFIS